MSFKRKQQQLEQRILYLFCDRSIEIEKPQFNPQWTEVFTQAAHRLNESGFAVTLYAAEDRTCLQFSIGSEKRKFRLSLDWDDDNQPVAVVEFLQFDTDYILNVLRPVFANTETLQDFTRCSGNAFYHPLTGTQEETVAFLCKTVATLCLAINKL